MFWNLTAMQNMDILLEMLIFNVLGKGFYSKKLNFCAPTGF